MEGIKLKPGLYTTANGSIAKLIKLVSFDRRWYWRGAATDGERGTFKIWFITLWNLQGENEIYPNLNIEAPYGY